MAMPRGPLCSPIGLLVAQHSTGTPPTVAGQPVQLASVVHAVPGFEVKAAHTLAPKPPAWGFKARVGTVASLGSGSGMIASSAGAPVASAAVERTSTVPLPWHVM